MRKNESGQVAVYMAILVIALIGATGFAIDSGRLYAQRRQTQNATDAAAMAAALKIADVIAQCNSGSFDAHQGIRHAFVEIAKQNGVVHDSDRGDIIATYIDADENALAYVGGGTIPQGANGVEITMTITDTAAFLKLLDIRHLVTSAQSMSMVGQVRNLGPKTGGLIPIAVPLKVVQELDQGQTFYMMEDNHKDTGGAFCLDAEANYCIGDSAAPHNAHRGWLNFNYIYNQEHLTANDSLNRTFERNIGARGCGSDPDKSFDDGLMGWAGEDKDGDGLADCPYPFSIFAGNVGYLNGDFIHGESGARKSALMALIDTYNHEIVYVPIFDYIYMTDYMDTHMTPPEEPPDGTLGGDNWPRAGGGGKAYMYHVVGFAAFRINEDENNNKTYKDHILVGNFQSAIIGQLGSLVPGSGVGGTCEVGIQSIALWR
jgi:hypothetical protein